MARIPSVRGYRMERLLGTGGMAAVFLATQETLNRPVAVKILANTLSLDERFRQRFFREAQIVAQLKHPNIIRVYEAGEVDDTLYMVTEYYDGGTLKERFDDTPLQPTEVLAIVRKLAEALATAHARGIFHRDIKPDNVLFDRDGCFVLADFGIAKSAEENGRPLTGTGAIIGTPQYMSPEQFKGEAVDGRSDIYSLGVMFYEMLAGKLPFTDTDPFALGIKHIKDPPPSLQGPLLQYQSLLDRMLAKDPAQRFADCHALVRGIDSLQGELRTEKMPGAQRLQQTQEITKEHKSNKDRPLAATALFVAITIFALSAGGYFLWAAWSNRSVPSTASISNTHAPVKVAQILPPSQTSLTTDPSPEQPVLKGNAPHSPSAGPSTVSPSVNSVPAPVSYTGPAPAVVLGNADQQQLHDMDFRTLEQHLEHLLAAGNIGELRASLDVLNEHPNADRVRERFKFLLTLLEQNGMPVSQSTLRADQLIQARAKALSLLQAKDKQLSGGLENAAERIRINRTILALDSSNRLAAANIKTIMGNFTQAIDAASAKGNKKAVESIRKRANDVDPEST